MAPLSGMLNAPNMFMGAAPEKDDPLRSANEQRQLAAQAAAASRAQNVEPVDVSTERQFSTNPIQRSFDPDAYLRSMAGGGAGMDKNTRLMSAIGYALQLGNPSFNPQSFITNYKNRQYAKMKQQWEAMSALDQQQVERQVVDRMMKADPRTVPEFKRWFKGLGIPNLGMMERTFKVWRDMHPAIDPDKEYLPGGGLSAKGIRSASERFRVEMKPLINGGYQWQRKLSAVMRGLSKRNGLGDIAAINAFQKMIDEGVVRGEDVKLIGGAVSAWESIKLWKQQKAAGDQLGDVTRSQMADMARSLFLDGSQMLKERILGKRDIVESGYSQVPWSNIVSNPVFETLTGEGLNAEKLKIPDALESQAFTGESREYPLKNTGLTEEAIANLPADSKFLNKWVVLPDGRIVHVHLDSEL